MLALTGPVAPPEEIGRRLLDGMAERLRAQRADDARRQGAARRGTRGRGARRALVSSTHRAADGVRPRRDRPGPLHGHRRGRRGRATPSRTPSRTSPRRGCCRPTRGAASRWRTPRTAPRARAPRAVTWWRCPASYRCRTRPAVPSSRPCWRSTWRASARCSEGRRRAACSTTPPRPGPPTRRAVITWPAGSTSPSAPAPREPEPLHGHQRPRSSRRRRGRAAPAA